MLTAGVLAAGARSHLGQQRQFLVEGVVVEVPSFMDLFFALFSLTIDSFCKTFTATCHTNELSRVLKSKRDSI